MFLQCVIDGNIKSAALSLLLAVGLSSGSVSTVLRVASQLTASDCDITLSPTAMGLVAKYAKLEDDHDISMPSDKVI
jgi:hypothetical protein